MQRQRQTPLPLKIPGARLTHRSTSLPENDTASVFVFTTFTLSPIK